MSYQQYQYQEDPGLLLIRAIVGLIVGVVCAIICWKMCQKKRRGTPWVGAFLGFCCGCFGLCCVAMWWCSEEDKVEDIETCDCKNKPNPTRQEAPRVTTVVTDRLQESACTDTTQIKPEDDAHTDAAADDAGLLPKQCLRSDVLMV
eukprot:TRINITY_DN112474_c0_g1_i1.p1 TRINITY_DN112474_c0_g1~~TRINITY_DN112474_c0_g1_i1.p1  ORF type:complete len:146 (+),score=12.08 TRINITY_DN112474_c0_g1_i1:69-506(+)